MSDSSTTTLVWVFGEVILKVKNRKNKISPIYELLANAPTITLGHYSFIYSLARISGRISDTDGIRLAVGSPEYLEGTLEKTANDVGEFVKYLNSCEDILSAEGKIDVRELNRNKDEIDDEIDKETRWTIKIKK